MAGAWLRGCVVEGCSLLLRPLHLLLFGFREPLGVRFVLSDLRLRVLRCKQPFIPTIIHPLVHF